MTNSSELAKLYSSDDSRLCSNTSGNYDFHRFVFEIPSCVTHIWMLHEGYGNGTEVAGHALYVWNGTAWEIPPVASIDSSGPPDHELTGELTGNFSKYIHNGTLNLLATATYTNGTLCTDYVRVGTTCPVGGEVLPIGKVSILAPWLGLAAFLAITMVVVVLFQRRRVA